MQKIIWTESGSWADSIAFSCPKTLKTLDAQKNFFPLPTFSQKPNTLLLLILNALPSLPGISSPYQWKPNRLNPPFAAFPSLSPPSLSKNPKKKKRNPLFFSLSTNIFSQIFSLSLSLKPLWIWLPWIIYESTTFSGLSSPLLIPHIHLQSQFLATWQNPKFGHQIMGATFRMENYNQARSTLLKTQEF